MTSSVATTADIATTTDAQAVLQTIQGCGCPFCSPAASREAFAAEAVAEAPALPDAAGIAQLDAQGFLIDPSSPASGLVGTTISGLPVWSAYQTAMHIARPGGTWADHATGLAVTYSFGVGATLPDGYEAFSTAAAREGALRAMALYEDVCGLTFVESADPSIANITYMFGIGSTNGGGWANYPSSGGGYVQVGHVSWEQTMDAGTYSLNLLLHELGHGVGLAHPGDYNGATAVYADADHFNDSAQYTNMSYWGETYTGASFSQLATLGLHDILAAQIEYGANWSTRSANTVYGFNSTAGVDSYDFEFDRTMGFSIWDGGGVDTLDFSGFTGATIMDLREGGFSSTGLETYNVSIAYGAVIENAVGGRGDDRIRGNAVANVMRGGDGDDTIYGGAETTPVAVNDPRAFIGIEMNAAPLTRNQYLSTSGVTALSGAAFTFESMVQITRSPSSLIAFASYTVGGNDQFLLSGRNDGFVEIIIANKSSYVTDFATEQLIDGNPHRISLTWDKATGAIALYVDGVLEHAGTYTAAIGANIGSGGTLVLGQDQDSVGGGFNTKQVFQGVMGDIRIFDDVRTAQEIADAAFVDLVGNEQGLAHNWQVEAGDTTSVSDRAGARMLSIFNGATATNSAPIVNMTPDNDRLIGGIGNDVLYGGAGNDILTGGGVGDGFAPVYGVELNAVGTTNQYAAISNYSGISGSAGAVQFTLEMLFQVSRLPASEVDFVSYANSQTANAFGITASNNGNVGITFRGATYDTGVSSSVLTDGRAHRLSLSWDGRAASAGFVLYLDGEAIASGVHAQQTSSLNAGGTLIFGQEQDSIGGGFQSSQIFPGTIADIRVFNTVRTAAEIAAGAFAPLADPTGEAGLVSNWQATSATTASVSDARGGAVLTLFNTPTLSTIGDWDDDSLWGGIGDDMLYGGAGDDLLFGEAGNDRLYGNEGANILNGGAGNDIFYVSSAADQVLESAELGSRDSVYTSVSYALGAGQEVEYLRAHGVAATGPGVTLAGNEARNRLYGGAGGDTLNGGAGLDYLYGLGGNDRLIGGSDFDQLYGGAGLDTFVLQNLPAHRDIIRDFAAVADQLEISASLFGTGLSAGGSLSGNQFIVNTTGRADDGGDGSTRFVYNSNTGALIFDSNGALSGGAALIATVYSTGTTAAALTASDFTFVA